MKNRVLSAVIMALIIIPVLYFGGIVFEIGVGIISLIAFTEIISVKKDANIPTVMKVIAAICMLMLMYLNVDGHSLVFGLNYETLSLVFLLLLAPTVLINKKKYRVSDAFYLASITLFLGTVFNLFITLFNDSLLLFIFVILVACVTDIFALLGGKLIGKHKLTPISPNKTIEGSLVGTIVSVIVSTTYYATLISSENVVKIVIITIILSVIGQIGDLFFSLIKRENDVKDYSNLIPGHGGILDRLDSIIFILIAFVFIMQYL